MSTSVFVKSAAFLVSTALLVPALVVDAQAAKKKAAKLECAVYELSPTDTGSSKGYCVQYKKAKYVKSYSKKVAKKS